MGLISLAGAVGWAATPEHKELIITAAVVVVSAVAAFTRDKSAAE